MNGYFDCLTAEWIFSRILAVPDTRAPFPDLRARNEFAREQPSAPRSSVAILVATAAAEPKAPSYF